MVMGNVVGSIQLRCFQSVDTASGRGNEYAEERVGRYVIDWSCVRFVH